MLAEGFKYRGLIKYFEEISAIPRATFSEERIAEYIYDSTGRKPIILPVIMNIKRETKVTN